MIICARTGCEEVFLPATHNQKYHNSECCRLATNAKIMQRYYANKARLAGTSRHCSSCDSKLSRYNDSDICNSCSLKQKVSSSSQVINMLMTASWQL